MFVKSFFIEFSKIVLQNWYPIFSQIFELHSSRLYCQSSLVDSREEAEGLGLQGTGITEVRSDLKGPGWTGRERWTEESNRYLVKWLEPLATRTCYSWARFCKRMQLVSKQETQTFRVLPTV